MVGCELIYPQVVEHGVVRSYLASNSTNLLKYLQKFSMHFDQIDDRNDFRFLLECDSLSELKLINVNFDSEVIAGVLTKNTYCPRQTSV